MCLILENERQTGFEISKQCLSAFTFNLQVTDSSLAAVSSKLILSFVLYCLLRFSLTPAKRIDMWTYCGEIPGWWQCGSSPPTAWHTAAHSPRRSSLYTRRLLSHTNKKTSTWDHVRNLKQLHYRTTFCMCSSYTWGSQPSVTYGSLLIVKIITRNTFQSISSQVTLLQAEGCLPPGMHDIYRTDKRCHYNTDNGKF